MTFVNDLSKKLGEVAGDAKDKAKDVADLAKAKAEILAEQRKVQQGYTELGKLYYERVKDTEEGLANEVCLSIKEAQNNIASLEAKNNFKKPE